MAVAGVDWSNGATARFYSPKHAVAKYPLKKCGRVSIVFEFVSIFHTAIYEINIISDLLKRNVDFARREYFLFYILKTILLISITISCFDIRSSTFLVTARSIKVDVKNYGSFFLLVIN